MAWAFLPKDMRCPEILYTEPLSGTCGSQGTIEKLPAVPEFYVEPEHDGIEENRRLLQ